MTFLLDVPTKENDPEIPTTITNVTNKVQTQVNINQISLAIHLNLFL